MKMNQWLMMKYILQTLEECTEILNKINELKDAKVIGDQLHKKLHNNISFSRVKSEPYQCTTK